MGTKTEEAWNDIITQLDIEFDNRVSQTISASEIKEITGEEPRLVCYIDSREKLPPTLESRNAFVLPVENGKYRLVKGKGYENLPTQSDSPDIHKSTIPFEQETNSGSSENRYIKQALNSGLISRFTGIDQLLPGTTARTYCNEFSFKVGSSGPITASSVQFQVDGIFEGKNSVALMEAKTDERKDFLIRQLYYPYRHHGDELSKQVRCLFFLYNQQSEKYMFWEYEFQDRNDYSSIQLNRAESYRIKHEEPNLTDFESVEPESNWSVPQADDLPKVQQLVFAVDRGYNNRDSIARYFDFEPRQSNYYEAAAEILGLIRGQSEFQLTELGEDFISLRTDKRNKLLLKRVLSLPVVNEVFEEAVSRMNSDEPHVSRQEIRDFIMENTELSKSTANRRTQTVVNWMRWASAHVGLLSVEPEGVRISL